MYVKLKLECSENSTPPQFLTIEDDATIYDLKTQLEPSIGIPAHVQQIHSLDKTIGDHNKVSAVLDCQVDKINGMAFSLYKNEEFVCFLQFYNQKEGERQTNFFSMPLGNRNLPIEKVAHLEISESEQSWSSSCSDTTTDPSSSSSGSSSNTSGSSKAKKYQKRVHKDNVKTMLSQEKRARLTDENMDLHSLVDDPVTTTISPLMTKSTELDAAADFSGYITASDLTPISEISVTIKAKDVPEPVPPAAPVKLAFAVGDITNAEVAKDATETVACIAKKQLVGNEDELTYAGVMPEKRRFALVITNEIDTITSGFGALMKHFHKLFETFEDCGMLQFRESASVKGFGNHLMIISDDKKTCDWITNGTSTMTPRYKCSSFIEFFGLIKCKFIMPIIVKDKELSIIFKLLEQQNTGIVTDKWVVTDRTMLDPKSDVYAEKAASIIVDNQEVVLYVDRESKTLISERGFKLKYCFWRLNFSFS